ncbi:MAG: hypothetical protein U1E59_19230 [Amaricoccus sp.]
MAGYSPTPLLGKLGYRDGQRALLVGLPPEPAELGEFAGFARRETRPGLAELGEFADPFDLIHVFERDRDRLATGLPGLSALLDPAGMIWVSWPKQAAKVPTTLTEDVIRGLALAHGLVDVKVCAVDSVWSGLKLVIPRALRR